MTAEEAEALVDDVEDAGGVVVSGALGLALEDEIDQDVLALAAGGVDFEVARDLAEFRHAHLAEVADLEVVPLAGGLELLLLLEFGDGGASAATDGGAASGSSVVVRADRAGRGRVRALGKGHLRVMGGPGGWCARNRCRSAGAGRDTWSIDVPAGTRQRVLGRSPTP